jgi:hypothetical protein
MKRFGTLPPDHQKAGITPCTLNRDTSASSQAIICVIYLRFFARFFTRFIARFFTTSLGLSIGLSLSTSFGFSTATGTYEDLVKAGIILAIEVERVALQNAASIASLLLTTECAIVDVKEKKKAGGGGHSHGEDMDYSGDYTSIMDALLMWNDAVKWQMEQTKEALNLSLAELNRHARDTDSGEKAVTAIEELLK